MRIKDLYIFNFLLGRSNKYAIKDNIESFPELNHIDFIK